MGPGLVIPFAATNSAQGWRTCSLTSSMTESRFSFAKAEIRGFWKPVWMWNISPIMDASWAWVVSPSSTMLKARPPFSGVISGEVDGVVEVQTAAFQAASAASNTCTVLMRRSLPQSHFISSPRDW